MLSQTALSKLSELLLASKEVWISDLNNPEENELANMFTELKILQVTLYDDLSYQSLSIRVSGNFISSHINQVVNPTRFNKESLYEFLHTSLSSYIETDFKLLTDIIEPNLYKE